MAFSPAGLDVMGDAITNVAVKAKLHTGDPGTSGTANNTTATGGTLTWTSVDGQLNLAAPVAFTGGAASGPVTWVSLWDSTVATFYGRFQVTSGDLSFNAAGAYTLNDVNITGS